MPHKVCDTFGRITRDETSARNSMMHSIRLVYLTGPPYTEESKHAANEEFKSLVGPNTKVSEAFALLDADQRLEIRRMVENPPLRVINPDGTELWKEANFHLLERLERGEEVGPVGETQLYRPPGTKAF